MSSLVHLATRFFGSLRPGPPSAADLIWADDFLTAGERRLLRRMSNPDQRHAIEVARAVAAELPDADDTVMAAALLHDVGKVDSGLRTPARVAATLFWAVAPDELADRWLAGRPGVRRRLASYRRHPEIGEQLLSDAGAAALTANWAADHHKPPARWRIDPAIGELLKRCDGD